MIVAVKRTTSFKRLSAEVKPEPFKLPQINIFKARDSESDQTKGPIPKTLNRYSSMQAIISGDE